MGNFIKEALEAVNESNKDLIVPKLFDSRFRFQKINSRLSI